MDGLVVSSLGLPMSYTRVDLIWLAITRCNSDPAGGWVRTLVGPPSRALSKWHVGSRMSVLVSICLLTLVKQSNIQRSTRCGDTAIFPDRLTQILVTIMAYPLTDELTKLFEVQDDVHGSAMFEAIIGAAQGIDPLRLYACVEQWALAHAGGTEVLYCADLATTQSLVPRSVLKAADFEKLIRVLVQLDNRIASPFGSGSTSQVHRLWRYLNVVDPTRAEGVCDWALTHARNSYVPFGGYNQHRAIAKTCKEYRENVRKAAERQIEKERHDQERARERRTQRAQTHAERIAKKIQVSEARQEIVKQLGALGTVKRLSVVVRDSEHPLWYFPEYIAEITDEEVAAMDPEMKAMLIQKLRHAPRGPWRLLRRQLN